MKDEPRIDIRPDMQRRGVGGRLVAHGAEWARKLGYPSVILAVGERHEKASASYTKYGFAVRKSVVIDDYIMEKILQA